MSPHRNFEHVTEQFVQQTTDLIKLIFDLTSRIDERVKMLIERQNDVEERLQNTIDVRQDMMHRIAILEAKDISSIKEDISEILKRLAITESHEESRKEFWGDMSESVDDLRDKIHTCEIKTETLQTKVERHDTRTNQVFDWILKTLFMIVGAFLLWKLGWQAPPIP